MSSQTASQMTAFRLMIFFKPNQAHPVNLPACLIPLNKYQQQRFPKKTILITPKHKYGLQNFRSTQNNLMQIMHQKINIKSQLISKNHNKQKRKDQSENKDLINAKKEDMNTEIKLMVV